MDGKELKSLRNCLGLTQAQMAEKLYITAGAVSRIESGENKMGKQSVALATQLEAHEREV